MTWFALKFIILFELISGTVIIFAVLIQPSLKTSILVILSDNRLPDLF